MRWLVTFAVLVLTAWPAAAEDNEAEKLCRGLEKKLRAAKTLRVRFDLAVTDARSKKWNLKGALTLGEGDRFRAEAKGKLFGEAVEFTEVSDGKSVRSVEGKGKAKDDKESSPKGAGAYFRAALPREGFLLAHLNLGRRGKAAALTTSGFEMAGKEKVGKRDARAVRFTLGPKGEGGMTVKLWLDAKTDLPLKLSVTGGKSDIAEVTETYSEFAIDPELDAKVWELPK
jgi:hypothetical protein